MEVGVDGSGVGESHLVDVNTTVRADGVRRRLFRAQQVRRNGLLLVLQRDLVWFEFVVQSTTTTATNISSFIQGISRTKLVGRSDVTDS